MEGDAPFGACMDTPFGPKFLKVLKFDGPLRSEVCGGRLHGHALAGVRVQKVQRVQRFDTAFGREGCGGRLRRQYKCRLRRRPPLVPVGTTFPPLKRWDYGYSALCHMKQQVSVEQTSPSGGKYREAGIGGHFPQAQPGWLVFPSRLGAVLKVLS